MEARLLRRFPPVTHDRTSPTLLIRIRDAENTQAWREFDARYRDLILAYCRRRGLQDSDAEDIRQVVMLSLFRRMRGFRYDPSRGRFRDYLGRCVSNAISKLLASPARAFTELEQVDSLSLDDELETDEVWEREWMQHHFRLALDLVRPQVEPRSVEVFERLLGGATIAEVASAMALSEAATHKIKQRMQARLSDLIAQKLESHPAP